MIKDAFLAYFFVPFGYSVFLGLKNGVVKKEKIKNILIAVFLGCIIGGWHYFRLNIIRKIIYEPITETVPIFNFISLKVMTVCLWEELLSPPIFIIFIIGLIFFIWKYDGKYKNIILLWFFVPWAIIMFMPHRKMTEYGLGFIPATMLFGALFLAYIRKQFIKKIILILVVVTGLFQYIVFSYFNHSFFDNIEIELNGENIRYYNSQNNLVKYNYEGMKKYVILFYRLKKYKTHNFYYNKTFNVDPFLISCHMYLNDMSCMLTNYQNLESLESDIILFIGTQNIKRLMDKEFVEILENPMNAKKATKEFEKELFKRIESSLYEIREKYHKIDEFYIDDNKNEDTRVILYGRKDKFSKFSE
jgi:hypothetical protein